MIIRLKPTVFVPFKALLAASLLSVTAIAQDIGNYQPEQAWDGNPDINGVWQAIGTAHWDLQDHEASAGLPEMGAIGAVPPGQGVVVGGEIPYQDWALEQKQANWDSRPIGDPETKCYLPGVPRATYLPYPFQILQGTDKKMIVYGFAEANRTIHMNVENTVIVEYGNDDLVGWVLLHYSEVESIFTCQDIYFRVQEKYLSFERIRNSNLKTKNLP